MSADIGFDLLSELGVRNAGRDPGWKLQAGVQAGAPTTVAQGVSIKDAINARVHVALRAEASRFGSRVRVATFVGSATYTVTIDGTGVAYDASAGGDDANAAETIQGIADAINANGTVNLIVVAAAVDTTGNGAVDTVSIKSIVSETATYTTAVSAGGGAALEFDEDATAADIRIWELPDADNDTGITLPWVQVNGGVFPALDYRGFSERFDISGGGRLYVEVANTAGPSASGEKVVVHVGPGGLE